jgi:hypothetical protein
VLTTAMILKTSTGRDFPETFTRLSGCGNSMRKNDFLEVMLILPFALKILTGKKAELKKSTEKEL